jgi:UDP-N-acetylglucosamine diphosphorylase/glucosamine-1-phosphate N-acetyltransferase
MNYILFDDTSWENLLPLTFTRPVSDIRVGILKISEKWEKFLSSNISYLTKEYLSKKYSALITDDNILINGSLLPEAHLLDAITKLKPNESLVNDSTLIAVRLDRQQTESFQNTIQPAFSTKEYSQPTLKISYPWDIFSLNEKAIASDFELITKGRTSADLSNTNRLAGENIFIEEGAKVEFSILNSLTGPIYIGKDAEIMEGAIVRGPLALCEHAVLKMGAKIYGATTIGPHSKVGGEISNSVIFGYSNKTHDGFLGNSVLGEWCNLGADTNNSNLKNNYALVKVWNYPKERFINTGLQFCGLIMGDHSKSGINTMFNTGTVVGVSANIFGDGFPRNFIPSFSWGGAQGFSVYTQTKAFEVATQVLKRRNLEFSDIDKEILNHIFEATKKYRNY